MNTLRKKFFVIGDGKPGRPKKKRKHPESDLQQAIVHWARAQYPILEKLLFAIPNGGQRSEVEAAIMKGEGVTPGVYDLFLSLPTAPGVSPVYHGFYLETKAPGVKKLSDKQKEWEVFASTNGYKTAMYNNFDDGRVLITEYMQQTIYRRILA